MKDATALTAPVSGPVPLPTSRDIRLELRALCREDQALAYFGAEDVRLGGMVAVALRRDAQDERGLLLPGEPALQLRAIYLQPDPPSDPTLAFAAQAAAGQGSQPGDVVQRLATALGLAASGMTLRAQPGRRIVLGCAPAVRQCWAPISRRAR